MIIVECVMCDEKFNLELLDVVYVEFTDEYKNPCLKCGCHCLPKDDEENIY